MSNGVSDSQPRTALPLFIAACVLGWLAGAAACRSLGIWAGVGGAAIVLGCLSIVFDGAALRDLLRPSLRLLSLGIAAAAIMLAGTYGLYPLLGSASSKLAADTHSLYALFNHAPRYGIVLLPVIILAEEVVWRGVVQGYFSRRLGRLPAVVLAAVLYAAAHAAMGYPLLVMLALICGLFWGALRESANSLVPGLIAHLIWDALVFLIYPLSPG